MTMSRLQISSAICLLALSIPATQVSSQTIERSEVPKVGEEVTATLGSPIWELHQYAGVPGVIIQSAVDTRWGSLEHVFLTVGTPLVVRREKKLKACQSNTTYANLPFAPSVWSNCLIDENNDGAFDKVSYSDGGFSKALSPPVPYVRSVVGMEGGGAPSFRKLLIYTGADAISVRLSYREFSQDMARPAFTEELILPIGPSLPQDVAVKDKSFRIIKIDGSGLTFVRTK